MLSRPLQAWQAVVRDDVLTMNPDLADAIERIDIWQWGHAMICPVPGFLSDPVRRTAALHHPRYFTRIPISAACRCSRKPITGASWLPKPRWRMWPIRSKA
jgi:hypothetical protein